MLPKLTIDYSPQSFKTWEYLIKSTLRRLNLSEYILDETIYDNLPTEDVLNETQLREYVTVMNILMTTTDKIIQNDFIDLIYGAKVSFDNLMASNQTFQLASFFMN